MFYVYKITNKINGKIYIGKRKYEGNINNDSYMGSGKLIKEAIKKYGKQNFNKEIINVFDNENDAFKLEKMLVTEEFCKRADTYNIHEGGTGSFSHINSIKKEERINIKKYKEMKEKGLLSNVGGNKNFNEETYKKLSNFNKNRWKYWKSHLEKMPSFKKSEEVKNKLSLKLKGENNPSFGKHWYIDRNAETIDKRIFLSPADAPNNYITLKEWKDMRKNKSKYAFGKHWFNDGIKNYLIDDISANIKKLNKGKIKKEK